MQAAVYGYQWSLGLDFSYGCAVNAFLTLRALQLHEQHETPLGNQL
jgi:hypothetical protein